MTGVENFFIYCSRKAKFGTGEAISANLSTGESTEAHPIGALGQGVVLDERISQLLVMQVRFYRAHTFEILSKNNSFYVFVLVYLQY